MMFDNLQNIHANMQIMFQNHKELHMQSTPLQLYKNLHRVKDSETIQIKHSMRCTNINMETLGVLIVYT